MMPSTSDEDVNCLPMDLAAETNGSAWGSWGDDMASKETGRGLTVGDEVPHGLARGLRKDRGG